jgi:glycine/D-amino acid oxidase-like deaminating enzyme/nitrite reductase/ring-hydroxylating ferredoxin subunit
MKNDGGKTDSIWAATIEISLRSPLAEDLRVNTCVVGAGIAGLTVAYTLASAGKSVVVLDDGPIGGGETGRTTAHLSNALDDRYYEIERIFGEEGSRHAAQSHTAAIQRVEEIVQRENIDCQFRRLNGYLFGTPGSRMDELEEELDAARRAGLPVTMVNRAPFPEGVDSGRAICFPDQAVFHPLRYLKGLAEAIERYGGRIFNHTHATGMQGGTPGHVKTSDGHTVTADHIVVCTNTPVNDWVVMHTKQAPYRTYVIGALVPRGSVRDALFWDTEDPYHYVRITPLSERHDVLIVGGEDHKTGQAHDTEHRFDRLEDWTRRMFPVVEFVEFRWSGQVMEPSDAMAFIGRNPGDDAAHVYIATGDSGNGMTHGTIAGMLIPDLILGHDNPWVKLYDPKRKPTRSLGEFAKENLNVAMQYGSFLTGGDVKSADDVPPGQGAVIRIGVQKYAVYRDDHGEIHQYSAVCPHLGCIVDWNRTERTWDCSCHGSRFDPYGRVVNGPANSDLGTGEDEEPEIKAPVEVA